MVRGVHRHMPVHTPYHPASDSGYSLVFDQLTVTFTSVYLVPRADQTRTVVEPVPMAWMVPSPSANATSSFQASKIASLNGLLEG